MADGVPVVQQNADAKGLPLVLADHVGLDGHAATDHLGGDLRFHLHQRLGVFLENVNQRRVQDQAVLDGLGPPFGQLALAQRGKRLHVGQDCPRLIERADHVLGLGQVDRHLAADGRVHHGGHAGRHLHEGHAAHEGAGDEPAQVAGHAAADGDDRLASLGFQAHQPLVDFLGLLEGLAGLAGRYDETMGRDAGPLQRPLGVATVGPHHVLVRDDVRGVAQAQFLDVLAQPLDDAPAGDDGVTAPGVVNGCG